MRRQRDTLLLSHISCCTLIQIQSIRNYDNDEATGPSSRSDIHINVLLIGWASGLFCKCHTCSARRGERQGATWYFALVFVSVQYLVVASLSVFDESRTEIERERLS